MRLIDADALLEKLIKTPRYFDLKFDIDDAPTIDAERVVHCRDCKHASECHKSVQYTRNELNTVTIGFSPIEWCSRGERREP